MIDKQKIHNYTITLKVECKCNSKIRHLQINTFKKNNVILHRIYTKLYLTLSGKWINKLQFIARTQNHTIFIR